MPEDGKRYEIIDGILYAADSPTFLHQRTVVQTIFQLQLALKETHDGMVLIGPIGVHLSEATRPVQPDGVFLSPNQMPVYGAEFIDGAPDLIIEVISPSSIRLDRHIKFGVYERPGVTEYWLVDPKAELVEVYTWQRGEYALFGQYTGEDVVTSKLLEGLQFKASLLFQPTLQENAG